ncbi:YL1 nuclear protein-domain-containing protein [Aspergillus granulosus]|uniref:YL1 nuclear protein-domain-containing protein n=1 Tax=Aspergillus granulosus TaxID=176169 RepID=A0ABR4HPS8_9EURO
MAHDDDRSSSEDEAPVESLIQGRAKRSTAGRHMSALLEAAADDDLALLFEEVEDDNEFAVDAAEEGGEEEDMGLESSSDEDDQGPSAQADDFEGERQLEKEEREEKKKKRAREDLRYRITSKKVKVDPTAPPTASAPRPRKKSERVSWIPTLEEGPTRSSSRRQTMQNKELTHARLKDSEEKRIRLIATMEEAAKRKAKTKPKAMTQAERLAEAERVERHNSKSVSRWEEMEKRKAEERRAKIEALQNRRLEGPVISYWSGVATWADGRLTRVGKVNITQKPEKEDGARKKSKKADKEGKAEPEQTEQQPSTAAEPNMAQNVAPTVAPTNPAGPPPPDAEPKQDQASDQQAQQVSVDAGQEDGAVAERKPSGTEGEGPAASAKPTESQVTATDAQVSVAAPSVILDSEANKDATKAQPEGTGDGHAEQPKPVAEAAETTEMPDKAPAHIPTSQPEDVGSVNDNAPNTEPSPKSGERPGDAIKEPVANPIPTTQLTSEPTSILPDPATPSPMQVDQESTQPPVRDEQKSDIHVDETTMDVDSLQPIVPPTPVVVEHTGRCLTILENFDDKTAQSREFNTYFNAKKPPRLTKISSSLCVITSLPSRYRDPDTSLPFANSYAYHEIRHTAAQKYAWSPMLGCYVGPTGVAARGVPERFLNPNAKESSPKTSGSNDESSAPTKKEDAPDLVDGKPAATLAAPSPAAPEPAPVTAGAGDAMDVDK